MTDHAIHLDLIGDTALSLRVSEGRMQIVAFDRRDGFTSKVPLSTAALAKLVHEGPKLLSAVDRLAALAREDPATMRSIASGDFDLWRQLRERGG